ncbi:hypothetical protein L210DRAFT_3523524 [Boletus edulis BED1]|uniref:RED-like N-terminal domain-containing protein n=1 Tax=Boletus edulis BED1 TaxID=1328754 RepID=A0AAD4C4H4_BOLED|nr:hypothetical protein L210DRAFT_3523524 [Boletus edulis BED1]
MDQDAFRQLLASSRRPQLNVKQPVPTTANNKQKATPSAPSEPAFKPRKVKKTESTYRDRAAERREGIGTDYAEVEAVLEDFNKRVAHEDRDVIEQQRMYLGGDSQHTILVKGLDMSLLEQNRARAAATTEDDEILEQVFVEATSISGPTEPRKRTREDIIRDLKAKRQNGDESADQPAVENPVEDGSILEAAKKARKFRPIGFKPIGQTEEKEKSRKRKVKEGKEGVKKKKRNVENTPVPSETNNKSTEETPAVSQECDATEPSSSKMPPKLPEPEPAPLDEDFDIFAGAGDYEGFPVDEESDEENRDMEGIIAPSPSRETVFPAPVVATKGWFDEPEPEVRQASSPPEKSPPVPETIAVVEEPQEIRLKPLESSALPSIRDFLAMDEAVERAEKRKARKEKKKKKKAGGDDDDD